MAYESLSDSELRGKLLEIGLDLPVSINREFLIKKLKSVTEPNTTKNGNRRKSVGRVTEIEEEIQPKVSKTSRGKSRLSLGVDVNSGTASRASSGSPGTKRRSQTRSSINNNNNINANTSTSINTSTSSSNTANKSSRVLINSPLNSINDNSEDDIPPPSSGKTPPRTHSSSASTISTADKSWSRKSSPQEWSRYSSAFPPTPPAASSFSTSSSGGGTSGSLINGNWNHHINSNSGSSSNLKSRFSMIGGRRSSGFFPNDVVTSVDRNSSSSSTTSPLHSDRGHLISMILVGFVVLGFGIITILYLNLSNDAGKVPGLNNLNKLDKTSAKTPSVPSSPPVPQPSPSIAKEVLSNNYPICGMPGVDNLACIQRKDVKTARSLFQTLKDELVQRAKRKGCAYDVEDKIPLNTAKTLLYRLSDKKKQDVDDVFNGMLILCAENPNWGLKIEKDETTELFNPKELGEINYTTTRISATNIEPSFLCQIWSYVQVTFTYFGILLCAAAAIYGLYLGYVYIQKKKKEEADEVFIFVENILQMLQEQYELAKDTGCDSFLAVNHIRDSLVPAKDRQKKSALWNRVVEYISNNESRVREEIQHISGEEFRVWRWLPNASPLLSRRSLTSQHSTPPNHSANHARAPINTPMPPSTKNACESPSSPPSGSSHGKWQGQAFEVSDNSPYAVKISPTNCLKIRQMFDYEANNENRQSRIESAILDKCHDSQICHIGISHSSPEGCVYVKCATKEDARKAYLALHGWWFDGHLLSVKFLKEENYMVRFPDSRNRTTPMTRR